MTSSFCSISSNSAALTSRIVTQSAETVVFDALAAAKEEYRRVAPYAHIFAEALLSFAVDFSDIHFSGHLACHALPVGSHGGTVVTPRGIKFDEPGIVGGGYQFLEALRNGALPTALSAGRGGCSGINVFSTSWAPTLGSFSPFCGLLPGLMDSRISSTHLLIASNVFAPDFLSTISPSLNSATVGNDLTSFPAHKSPLATQSTLANLKFS
ncbi:hypothetical protein KC354_g60 [Hortaea werneckii]|nr:hypothetical protein KC354_g60 [Hortaea werneckii]